MLSTFLGCFSFPQVARRRQYFDAGRGVTIDSREAEDLDGVHAPQRIESDRKDISPPVEPSERSCHCRSHLLAPALSNNTHGAITSAGRDVRLGKDTS